MQRELVVMRHAKSDWKTEAASDHARPLNARGRRDAPRVAAALLAMDCWPDAVWSSDALRTRETWAAMADIGGDCPTHFDRALYLADYGDVRGIAETWPAALGRVLVLGHNPGWEAMVARLSGSWQELTTANAVVLRGAGATWPEALDDGWTLVRWIRPRELDEQEPT